MQKYKTALIAAAIMFAVFVPLLSAVKADRDQKKWPIVRFSIEPYDPRDLMYGHYMRFQIRWNWKQDAPRQEELTMRDACLCVGEGEADPEIWALECPSADKPVAECRHIIRGDYNSWRTGDNGSFQQDFNAGIDRYYVDEAIALPLEKLFFDKKEEFSIGLGLSPKGKPVMEGLYVGGIALREYIMQNKDELFAKPASVPKEGTIQNQNP